MPEVERRQSDGVCGISRIPLDDVVVDSQRMGAAPSASPKLHDQRALLESLCEPSQGAPVLTSRTILERMWVNDDGPSASAARATGTAVKDE